MTTRGVASLPFSSLCLSYTACLLQLELSRRLPLCYASLIGTHNSGITLADGYGNLDLAYQHYFRWISWVVSRYLGCHCFASLQLLAPSACDLCPRDKAAGHPFTSFLQASDAYLQTNNQYLSLTDQMNLGVRIVELDTHFFDVSVTQMQRECMHHDLLRTQ